MNGFVIKTKSGYKPTHLKKGDKILFTIDYENQTVFVDFKRGKNDIYDGSMRAGHRFTERLHFGLFSNQKEVFGTILGLVSKMIRLMTCGLEMVKIADDILDDERCISFRLTRE